jgi:DNA-binding CsgD family transcriptional regulator
VRDIDSATLGGILQHIYAACLDSAETLALPQRLAAAFDAPSCFLQLRVPPAEGATMIGGTENCVAAMPAYAEYYYALDVWYERIARRGSRAHLGEEVAPLDEFLSLEWYNDFARPNGMHHLVGSVFELSAGGVGAVAIHRPADAHAFTERERALLDLLRPHLLQAYELMRRRGLEERTRRLSFDTLAALATAVLVVNARAEVRMMNAAAERLICAGLGLQVRNGRLGLTTAALDDRLKVAVRCAALAPLGRSLFAGETISAPWGDGSPVSIAISPLPADVSAGAIFEPLAAVFVSVGVADTPLDAEAIRAAYGLTAAEARVVLAVVGGQRLADFAAAAGISFNTAQVQLHSVFAKTGLHRQADLVREVLGNPVLRLARKSREN